MSQMENSPRENVEDTLKKHMENVVGTLRLGQNTSTSARDHLNMRENGAEDFQAFVSSLRIYGLVILLFGGAFCALRLAFPVMYAYYSEYADTDRDVPAHKRSPCTPPLTLFGWVWPTITLRLNNDCLDRSIGLDHAMLLEFSCLCMRMCGAVGLPLVLMCPLHYHYGGNQGVDQLSQYGMRNIKNNYTLYNVHAIIVWYVVLMSTWMIDKAQNNFIKRREKWLKTMPEPRATTVLVRRIPRRYCTDAGLKAKFEEWFPHNHRIKEASTVKKLDALRRFVRECDEARGKRKSATYQMDLERDREASPMVDFQADAILSIDERTGELEESIEQELRRVEELAEEEGGLNSSSGFVTFRSRRDVQVAVQLQYTAGNEWTVSYPPEPGDVRYHDLARDPAFTDPKLILGYLCVVLLFLAYSPFVIVVTALGSYLRETHLTNSNIAPFLKPVLEALLPTLGLGLFMSYLPTFLMYIFHQFFGLSSNAQLQHHLQFWYFWFQVIFVLMATMLGDSVFLWKSVTDILQNPLEISSKLARALPSFTHFYMNFLVMQWSIHFMNLSRYINIALFLTHRTLHDEKMARTKSEPEDQDYYGIGSRSARWAIDMLIGVIYGQLNPLIWILVFVNFAVCRLVYGYLIVFAEQRKPDLGGVFWVSKLWQILYGLLIYVILMTGVLWESTGNIMAGNVAACSGLYLLWFIRHFSLLKWHNLPYSIVPSDAAPSEEREQEGSYVQPELLQARSSHRRREFLEEANGVSRSPCMSVDGAGSGSESLDSDDSSADRCC